MLPYGVGIDCHKKFIQVCCLVQREGTVLRFEREFNTTWTDLCAAHAWAIQRCDLGDGTLEAANLRYSIESTGTYHNPVLLAWRGQPSVVNPMLAGQTRRKTDVLDARALAQQNLMGLWPASFIPERQGEVLRILMGMRFECGRNATRLTNRINNNILRFGHTLGREHKMQDMYTRAIVEDMCHGVTAPGSCIAPDGLPKAIWPFFLDSYALWDDWQKVKTKYHKLAIAFVKGTTWPVGEGRVDGAKLLEALMSVPGVGEVSALTWLSVVCDPRRFEFGKQVAAFCGADPSLKVSAGKVTSHAKRKGNARLHHVLKNVASSLVRLRNEPLGQWAFAIHRRNAKGGWAKAINALSRRLAICMWHVHRKCEAFSYDQYRFYDIPDVIDVKIDQMDLGPRYTAMLKDAGMVRSTDIARALMTSLPEQKGIGAGCLSKVKAWVQENLVKPNPNQVPLPPHSQRNSPHNTPSRRQAVAEFLNPPPDSSSTGPSSAVAEPPSPPRATSRKRSSSRTASSAAGSPSTLTSSTRRKSTRSSRG
jgi:transposase